MCWTEIPASLTTVILMERLQITVDTIVLHRHHHHHKIKHSSTGTAHFFVGFGKREAHS